MPDKRKSNFDVGKSLPNMLADANQKPELKPRPLPEQKPPVSWKRRIVYALLALLIIFVASVGWLSYKFQANCAKVFKDCTIFSLFDNTPLRGESRGRVNILLVGNSVDDPGHSGAKLTDSLMLISLNPKAHTGYMLSIPRDLHVNIPGIGPGKINAVYEFDGIDALKQVVSQDLGVPIDYYALISYNAFRDTVNAVGGITVNIKSSDPRGIYDPSLDYTSLTCCALAKYPNGPVKLNGKQALNLARARGDAYGSYGINADFGRTEDQRMMLSALKDKASSFGTLINPLKLGSLLDAVGKNVQTDFRGNNIHRLASIVKSTPDSQLKSVGLNDINGKSYLASYGGDLIPAVGLDDFSQIQAYVAQLNQN